MRRVWDSILGILITMYLIHLVVQMLRPYAWIMAIAVVVAFLANRAYNRYRRW